MRPYGTEEVASTCVVQRGRCPGLGELAPFQGGQWPSHGFGWRAERREIMPRRAAIRSPLRTRSLPTCLRMSRLMRSFSARRSAWVGNGRRKRRALFSTAGREGARSTATPIASPFALATMPRRTVPHAPPQHPHRQTPCGLLDHLFKRLEVPLFAEDAHSSHGPIQHVVGVTSAGDPQASWHGRRLPWFFQPVNNKDSRPAVSNLNRNRREGFSRGKPERESESRGTRGGGC